MRRDAERWPISRLIAEANIIKFPDYQREPTVWSRDAKQRLIDSIARGFDIASIYFYANDDGSWDCVDGRQRIGAIMAFLSKRPESEHNGFPFKVLNEVVEDGPDYRYWRLDSMTYGTITELAERASDMDAMAFSEELLRYELTVVTLRDSKAAEEFNLQFARLNLGTIINSGEKLHAMVGELRELCFDDLGRHEFLATVPIPTRRFAREQLAAQIVAQIFATEAGRESGAEFARTRHLDLQRLFKTNVVVAPEKQVWLHKLRKVMDCLAEERAAMPPLRSRAIVLSTVVLAYNEEVSSIEDAKRLVAFVGEFVRCLRWQIHKGLDVDREYDYLVEFQRHLRQASVEKPAVRRRAMMLKDAYEYWRENNQSLRGDAQYKERTERDPKVERESAAS